MLFKKHNDYVKSKTFIFEIVVGPSISVFLALLINTILIDILVNNFNTLWVIIITIIITGICVFLAMLIVSMSFKLFKSNFENIEKIEIAREKAIIVVEKKFENLEKIRTELINIENLNKYNAWKYYYYLYKDYRDIFLLEVKTSVKKDNCLGYLNIDFFVIILERYIDTHNQLLHYVTDVKLREKIEASRDSFIEYLKVTKRI